MFFLLFHNLKYGMVFSFAFSDMSIFFLNARFSFLLLYVVKCSCVVSFVVLGNVLCEMLLGFASQGHYSLFSIYIQHICVFSFAQESSGH